MLSRPKILTALAIVLALGGAAAAPVAAAPAAPAKAGASEARPIDLNTADAAALESVPGIGKSLSQRILAFREKNGPFKKIEEIMNVRGIGEKSFLRIKDRLTVAPPSDGRK